MTSGYPLDSTDVRRQIMSMTPEQIRAFQSRMDPGLWAMETARISLPKGAFSFEGRNFIRQVYRDTAEEIVVIKGAQMGFSVMAIIRALWAVTTFPLSVIYCVDATTELLSRRGWLKWHEVEVGEDILTFDRETSTSRWSAVEEVFVKKDYVGPMVHMTGQRFDALVTPNHRWIMRPLHGKSWRFFETDSIPAHQMLPLAVPFVDAPTTPIYSDDFVELAAWTITEGHYRHYSPGETVVTIVQNPGPKADRIRVLLDRSGSVSRRGRAGPHEYFDGKRFLWHIDGPPAQALRNVFPSKELTTEFVMSLTQGQLHLLIETMLDGDGDRAGREMFHQKSKATSDAFALACVLTGRAFSMRKRERDGFEWYETRVRKDRFSKSHKIKRTTVDYEGVVWCPRTRDGTFFMRHGPTGNVLTTGNTFPTQGDVSRFTASRINPIIQSSNYLDERILDFNSVGMKQFSRIPKVEQRKLQAQGQRVGLSTIYFNGAQNSKDATSIDADLLIHDEEDRSDPQTIEEYQSRLYASKYKWMLRLSTPTIPGMGIDRQWLRTDMRRWLIRCRGCNTEFEMDFPANIEPQTYDEVILKGVTPRYKCARCGKTITEDDRQGGRWVAEHPNIPAHGYSISQMSALGSPLHILEQYKKATYPLAFWNLIMARPWIEGTNAITREGILARQDEDIVGETWPRATDSGRGWGCTMGVDVGKFLDVVIGTSEHGIPRTIEMKRLGGDGRWDDLNKLMTDYGVVSCVIDSQPEDHQAHVFAHRWPGRVYRCRYSDGRVKDVKFDASTSYVTAPRTETLSKSAEELLHVRILPKFDNSEAYNAYIAHHTNSRKVPIFRQGETADISITDQSEMVDNPRMIERYEWRETGPDHMFHAATYEMLARMGYSASMGLPTVGLVTYNRYKLAQSHDAEPRRPDETPLLMPSFGKRAKRRTF